MLSWEMSMEPVQLRRKLDDDDGFEDDGYQLPDVDDEDEDDDEYSSELDDEDEDEYEEYEEEFEDEEDFVPRRRERRSDWDA